jgi:hypothetical protein
MNVPAIELTAPGRRARKSSNPTRVKKFLPQLLAFLLCFAGGMSLCPAPVDRSKSLAVTTILNLPGAPKSYDDWVEQCKADTEDDAKRVEHAKAEGKKSNIDQYWIYIKNNEKLNTWYDQARKSEAYQSLKTAAEQVSAATAEVTGAGNKAFAERMGLYKEYIKNQDIYKAALKESGEKLKELVKGNPPESTK